MDMFVEELASCQAEEIERLKTKVADLENACKWMNMVYRSAWDIAGLVCADGEYTLSTEDKLFMQLYDRMQAYDDNQDLRDRFDFVEKD